MKWVKFKTTKDTKGKMAFIITNNDYENVFNINYSRRSVDLKKFLKDITTYLINTNIIFKSAYECYQSTINFIKNKDFKKLKYHF